ncbi:mucin-5B-like [Halichondria panicea]|uniref:mucin-5B-like n=1 Tax=Halichondria panicea TaxID=6063 RepID=UPI00312B61E5
MKFVFVLLVAVIHCRLSIGGSRGNNHECNRAINHILEIDEQCATIRDCCLESDYDCPESLLRERCPSDSLEPCMTVTATHTVSYAPPAPSCPTTTTVITEYLSITPTNCLQSTHTKEMSTTVDTGARFSSSVTDDLNTTTCICSLVTVTTMSTTGGDSKSIFNTATGGATSNSNQGTTSNSSLVILGAFIAVLAALLVAVTTGWIVTCVVNRRKDKGSTTSNKDNYALQNPVYMSNVTKATRLLVHRQATAHRVRLTSRSGLTRELTMMSLIAVDHAHQTHTLSLYLTKTTVHWILTSKSMTIMC